MSDSKHVDQLWRGSESWNQWAQDQRATNPKFIPDLSVAPLTGIDLEVAQLQRTNLFGVQLNRAILRDCLLQKSDLTEAQLQKAQFLRCSIEEAVFDRAEFDDAVLIIESLDEKTSFQDTRFSNCLLSIEETVDQKTAVRVLAEGIVNNVQFVDPVFGRKVRDQAWLNKWREDIRRRFPKIESLSQLLRFRNIGRLLHWLWGRVIQGLWFATCNYGRNTWPWILWSCGLMFIFALIFNYLGIDHYNIKKIPREFWGFGTYLYYSVVTFTTLGFGDITAKSHWGMFWASLEVILGYVMLGGLISIFATKVARRND